MGFRHRVRAKISTTALRRKSTVDDNDAASTKTAPLGRTRTNSSASNQIPAYLRHTKSIPSSIKTLFSGHSRNDTETSTLGHRPSTVGATSVIGSTLGSSLETSEPASTGSAPAQAKTEGTGSSVSRTATQAGTETQSGRPGATLERSTTPQPVYPESQGKYAQTAIDQPIEVVQIDPRPVDDTPTKPVVNTSPVRNQPQEAYSYPAPNNMRPVAPPRSRTSEKNAANFTTSRGLPDAPSAPTGLKMKLKLAWMGLKTKAKM